MVHQVVRAWRRAAPLFLGGALGFALVLGAVDSALAQTGVVTGTVVESKARRPLADATVVIEGTTTGARTGTRGEFRLANLSGTTVRLRITRVGFQPTTVDRCTRRLRVVITA